MISRMDGLAMERKGRMKRLSAVTFLAAACSAWGSTQTASFADDAPDGWTVENGAWSSPAYAAAVDSIRLEYGGEGSATVYAGQDGLSETQIAALNSDSSAAALEFPETTDFRKFKVVASGGWNLLRFSAEVSATSLETPASVAISNNVTGTSFDAHWSAVSGATGYKVYVWTNAVAGAIEGTVVWQETMPGATNSSSSTKLADAKFNACFENLGWTRSDKAGYPTGEDGTIRIGTSGDNGYIQTPAISHAADGMAVRFHAKANASNTKSMDVAIERVSGDVATLAGTATLTVEMQEFTVALPGWTSGDSIRFNSITNGDRRTIIGAVSVIAGRAEGRLEPSYIVDGLDVGVATSYSFSNLPSVPVYFAVEAYGRRGVSSGMSVAAEVDLTNPDKVAVLNACPLSSLAASSAAASSSESSSAGSSPKSFAHAYTQDFDSLASLTVSTGDKEWLNGTTLRYWQAYKGNNAVTAIKYNGGAGNSGGLYALATNQNHSVRAIGAYSSQSDEFSWGIAFTNDMDNTLSLASLAYASQQWGFANTNSQPMSVSVLVTNSLDWISAYGDGWTELARTESAVYASTVVHDTPVSTSVDIDATDLSQQILVAPGQVLMLKWTLHSLKSGKPGIMGIDDVSLSFATVPTTYGTIITIVSR